MRPALLFDVNETLLDLRALDAPFARAFGDASARPGWFAQMLQISFVGALTGDYVDFTSAQHAALQMVAQRLGVTLTAASADEIVGTMARLPPHPDVLPALERLAMAGFRLATLTNSLGPVVEAQLAGAGIRQFFERALSADAVGRLKPAPEPYRMAAAELGVPIGATCLIAAHAWDVAGALAAGCQAAFVARPGALMYPIGRQPEIIGRDIAEVADRLIERWPNQ
jgi:2-haloacid dehalogenase